MEDEDELATQYVVWTQNAASELRSLIDQYEDGENGENTGGLLQQIYDLAHNIKGMGSSFSYDLMTIVGTSLCEYLKRTDLPGGHRHKVINAHIRAIEVVIANEIKGTGGEKGDRLVARLEALIAEE